MAPARSTCVGELVEIETRIERHRRLLREEARHPPRPLRVARMLALVHTVEAKIKDGTFASQADAARSLGFSRGRLTQLCLLATLAPDIQEELLFATVACGRDWVSERGLRGIVRSAGWARQRKLWRRSGSRRHGSA